MTMTKPTAEQVTFKSQGLGAITRTVQDRLSEVVSVKDFGAVGDGVADDTAAIQAAIDNFPTGSGTVYFPKGTYLVTSTISITQDSIDLVGSGVRQSQIRFVPTGNDICLFFGKGGEGTVDGGVIYECSVQDLFLFSPDTTYTKVGIEMKDISNMLLERVKTGPIGNWSGAGSIGIRVRGREFLRCIRCSISADKPIVIDYNDNSPTICADLFSFRDLYLSAASGYANITIADKVVLFNTTFETVSMNGGDYGVYWNNTTGAISTSLILQFLNCRYEQAVNPTSYAFYFKPAALYILRMSGCHFGGGNAYPVNGVFLRDTFLVNLESCLCNVTGGREIINADSTVKQIKVDNCYMQTGGTSAITGPVLVNGWTNYVTSGIPENALFLPSAMVPTTKVVNAAVCGSTVVIADTAVYALPTTLGILTFVVSDGTAATILLRGSSNAVAEISDPSGLFTTTKGTLASYNVYYSAANSRYEIENLRGGSRSIRFIAHGTNNAF